MMPDISAQSGCDTATMPITPSVRPQSPTGRGAPVSATGAAGAHPVMLLNSPPADQAERVIDGCWRRGIGVRDTMMAVKRHTKVQPDFERVRSRFAMLANAFCSGPP